GPRILLGRSFETPRKSAAPQDEGVRGNAPSSRLPSFAAKASSVTSRLCRLRGSVNLSGMFDPLSGMFDPFLLLIAGAFLLAGFVKGMIGLGLPTVSMGLLAVTMPPAQALALVIVPAVVTNI